MNSLLVRHILFPLHERIKGKTTLNCLNELEKTQWLDPQELDRIRLERLQNFLKHAYSSVPYYRNLFDAHEFCPESLRSISDIKMIPYLTKEIIRENPETLRSQNYRGRMQKASTGGSTGVPVTVYWDANRLSWDTAAQLRSHRWFGIDVGEREAVLWGSPIEITKQHRVREFRDRLINTRLLSAFNISEKSLQSYLEILKRWRPAKIYCYVSVVYLFAKFLETIGQRAPLEGLKGIFVTAEPLHDFQREAIEKSFGCPVSVEYGSRDVGAIAHQCLKGGLHINAEQVIVELLHEDGDADEGEQGEIVVTNMSALGMPLVRYRTGDIGTVYHGACSCGRSLPMLGKVEGRSTDFLMRADGSLAHALSVIYVLRELKKVRQFRVTQESVDHLSIDVALYESLTEEECSGIRLQMRKIIGDRVQVEIRHKEEIEPLPSGKHRYVISKVTPPWIGKVL